jgi:hypothetical protein
MIWVRHNVASPTRSIPYCMCLQLCTVFPWLTGYASTVVPCTWQSTTGTSPPFPWNAETERYEGNLGAAKEVSSATGTYQCLHERDEASQASSQSYCQVTFNSNVHQTPYPFVPPFLFFPVVLGYFLYLFSYILFLAFSQSISYGLPMLSCGRGKGYGYGYGYGYGRRKTR